MSRAVYADNHSEYFRKRKNELGLSYADIARHMGCTRGYALSIVTGRRLMTSSNSAEMRRKFYDALQIEETTIFVEKPSNRKRKP